MSFKRLAASLGLVFLVSLMFDVTVLAQGASSGYRIDESFIGPGSSLESGSGNYNIEDGQQATGGVGTGESESGNFKVLGGSTTSPDPVLSCQVDATSLDFGTFSTAVTSTATATFSVSNYTSYGYNVRLLGGSPSIGTHSLNSMSSESSSVGTEQFGINLVANTSPAVFGAFPEQSPSSDFSSGDATANYSTPNTFRYVESEPIAAASESSGQTNYTISYVINVSNDTPGGVYTAEQAILCTGSY